MCIVYFICIFSQLRAFLYLLCAFVILNKEYLLTYLLTYCRPRLREGSRGRRSVSVAGARAQWRSQDLEVGAQGIWGTEVPQRGPEAEPLVGGSGA